MAGLQQRKPVLDDDQKFMLMKFRRNVADVVRSEDDDYFLLRWLRARKWNLEAAEKMLRNHFKNRKMWNFDQLEKWDRPKIFTDYVPQGICGFDKEGSPIVIIPFAGMDMWGMLHCVTRFDFMRNTVLLLERYLKIAYEKSKTHGPQARQFVVIFDMENFFLKQYIWRPATELVITLIKNYELNYPEILKSCYIINAPKIFHLAFNVVKKFLDEYTLSKIQIFKHGSNKWLPKLLTQVDPSELPKYYGGTLTDEDGDPKCKSKICWGGRIPKDMYKTKNDEENNNFDFEETVINKGGKLKLEFESKDDDSILRWIFKTIDHDIRFGVKSICNKTGEKTVEVPLGRVESQHLDEIGFIFCRADTKYVVCFDNSYSYMRSKKIRYSIAISSTEEIEKASDILTNNGNNANNIAEVGIENSTEILTNNGNNTGEITSL